MSISLNDLKKWFNDNQDKLRPINTGCERIDNPKRFIESHIAYLEANPKNKAYKPYYDRLFNYYKTISNES